jgi:hypothetical protein
MNSNSAVVWQRFHSPRSSGGSKKLTASSGIWRAKKIGRQMLRRPRTIRDHPAADLAPIENPACPIWPQMASIPQTPPIFRSGPLPVDQPPSFLPCVQT